jgi:lysophospholipase L1-like esterase
VVLVFTQVLGAIPRAEGRPDAWVGAWGFPATAQLPADAAPTATGAPAGATGPSGAAGTPSTLAATAAPPVRAQPAVATFNKNTVRQIVRISVAAERLRIRVSNEFGDRPMRLGSVHVALVEHDGETQSGSDHVVRFSGSAGVTIPAHAPMLSDPVDWQLPALAQIAISVFLPQETPPPAHRVSEYVSAEGDFTASPKMPGAELVRTGALVSQVEVSGRPGRHVVVTFGDSITEGFGSTVNAFHDWSDLLAERLGQDRGTRGWAVVNAGINSNRLLHDTPGENALARFDRDALAVPGIATVILLEGINDIGYSFTHPGEAITADEIIAADMQLVARAHAHGIRIIGGTLTPFEGSHYYDPAGEQIRQAVNRWIRSGGAFDGVVDFDQALCDPSHPARVSAPLERGDHLHPNDLGYAAMAHAIDLELLAR